MQKSLTFLPWLQVTVLLSSVGLGLMGAAAMEKADSAPATEKLSKAVLVTGASSGIGRKITERLAADGYLVYATARKKTDLTALGAIRNVQPVRLDVTQPADIAAAVELITKAGRGLYGLVNNAGVVSLGSISDMSFEEFELVMAVNVYGPVRMIRAFEPLVIAQRGRIINIGSISGILASKRAPGYSMSKHAIESLTDSLADQIAPLGVQVSIVEPGAYNSDIIKNALARNRIDSENIQWVAADKTVYQEPDDVAVAVERALFDPNPKRRYLVVPTENEAEITIRKQIEQLVQLNEDQPYTYDRTALLKMLDEALSTARPRTKYVGFPGSDTSK